MKKAKIMLAVLLLLATAGGVLAVKASKASKGVNVVLYQWNRNDNLCDIPITYINATLTDENSGLLVLATPVITTCWTASDCWTYTLTME